MLTYALTAHVAGVPSKAAADANLFDPLSVDTAFLEPIR